MKVASPVRRLELDGLTRELWLKNDGVSLEAYGGNKTRKALRLLEHAAEQGARRVLTFGAAGSHHVLATTLLAPSYGLSVAAVLTPQPATDHAKAVLGRGLRAGLTVYPAGSHVGAAWRFARGYRRGDYVVPPGGSNARGAAAYALAIVELEGQVAAGLLPAPDWIVVPLGSGGTAAGLLAGLARSRLPTRLLAVSVLGNPFAAAHVRFLAGRTLQLLGGQVLAANWRQRLVVDATQVGLGYGRSTRASQSASRRALAVGLTLEPTYTAKAFAAALRLASLEESAAPRVLYWHTLSETTEGTPFEGSLPPELERLFLESE